MCTSRDRIKYLGCEVTYDRSIGSSIIILSNKKKEKGKWLDRYKILSLYR